MARIESLDDDPFPWAELAARLAVLRAAEAPREEALRARLEPDDRVARADFFAAEPDERLAPDFLAVAADDPLEPDDFFAVEPDDLLEPEDFFAVEPVVRLARPAPVDAALAEPPPLLLPLLPAVLALLPVGFRAVFF